MARFVISGRKEGRMWCYYVGRAGSITTSGEGAAVFSSLAEVKREVDVWRKEARDYRWFIDKLPPRVSVAKGVLHSEEIDY